MKEEPLTFVRGDNDYIHVMISFLRQGAGIMIALITHIYCIKLLWRVMCWAACMKTTYTQRIVDYFNKC